MKRIQIDWHTVHGGVLRPDDFLARELAANELFEAPKFVWTVVEPECVQNVYRRGVPSIDNREFFGFNTIEDGVVGFHFDTLYTYLRIHWNDEPFECRPMIAVYHREMLDTDGIVYEAPEDSKTALAAIIRINNF